MSSKQAIFLSAKFCYTTVFPGGIMKSAIADPTDDGRMHLSHTTPECFIVKDLFGEEVVISVGQGFCFGGTLYIDPQTRRPVEIGDEVFTLEAKSMWTTRRKIGNDWYDDPMFYCRLTSASKGRLHPRTEIRFICLIDGTILAAKAISQRRANLQNGRE
jgi:hypothetical protein